MTTTTTTSTTTTTTTLPVGQVVPQETSRGDLISQNPNQSPQDASKKNITAPGIVNIFAPTIKPDSINIYTTTNNNNSGTPPQTTNEVANGLGNLPVVWYNSYQIDTNNVKFLSLYDDGIAPCMNLTFIDTLGIMKDKAFPLDDTKITLFLSSRSDQLKPIFLQFKIRDFSNNNGTLTISSILDVSNLYVKKFKSYPSMTSNQVLQSVCKEVGLGFNSNITDTNDRMTWINTGEWPYNFISDVVSRAYISDQSFLVGYIDYYYSLTYVDVQKELSRDISNELGVISTGLADILKLVDTNNDNISSLILTNDESVSGQNIHFNSFNITNNSTSISLECGYKDVVKYYDTLDKSLLDFTVNSLNNNSNSSILLKGAPQDESFFNNNVNYSYTGKMDSDNMHKNYHYSETNNNRNINDSQKISMEIDMTTPNYNIYRYQKIKVILSSNTPTPASPMINQRLSGDWLIIDIKFIFNAGTLRQKIVLTKRELELSDDELASEPQSNVKGESGYRGSYDNPSPGTGTTTNTTTSYESPAQIINANGYKLKKILPTDSWENIAADFIAYQEGFAKKAYLDTGNPRKWRAGYGTDHKLVNGHLIEVTQETTFNQTEAAQTLAYQLRTQYGPEAAHIVGQSNWDKLNNNQKASLASLHYNGALFKKTNGQQIANGISDQNYQAAANSILNSSKTTGGKYSQTLADRRQEEASLFMTA